MDKKYLPNAQHKQYQFLSLTGEKGKYELFYTQDIAVTPESDQLLSHLQMERNESSRIQKTLHEYSIEEGKIVSMGKLLVKYHGGKIEDGNIKYTYTFHFLNKDTTALHAFRQSYPELYIANKDNIIVFRSELDDCLDYILSHLSDGKRLFLQGFIDANPDKTDAVFKDLKTSNQDEYIRLFEGYSFEELIMYCNR